MRSVVGGLRSALRDNLKDNVLGVNVYPYYHPNPSPPLIHIWPSGEVNYHGAMQRGKVDYTFTVQVMVDWTEDGGSQSLLDTFYDPSGERSIVAAIESDRTLGGLAEEVQVTGAGPYEVLLTQDNRATLTVDFTVLVIVDGSA